MILFSLMTTWMWFQIFGASCFRLSCRSVEASSNAEIRSI
jgi:hypothetical protein